MTIPNLNHSTTLQSTIKAWRESEGDVWMVSKDGDKISTHSSIFHLYSSQLSSIFKSLSPTISTYSVLVDASSASISALLSLLWTGEATSFNIDDLASVEELAKSIGIDLANCDYDSDITNLNIDIKEECESDSIYVDIKEEVNSMVIFVNEGAKDHTLVPDSGNISEETDDMSDEMVTQIGSEILDIIKSNGIETDDINYLDETRHVIDSGGDSSFSCPQCNAMVSDKSTYVEHFKEAHCTVREDNVICIKCREVFAGISALSHHIVTVHWLRSNNDTFLVNVCDICELSFKTKKMLRRHEKSIHQGIKKSVCQLCLNCFRDNFGLVRHMAVKHDKMPSKVPEKRIKIDSNSQCPLCKKSIKRLKRHLKESHGVDNFEFQHTCTYCEKQFRDNYNLKRHIGKHQTSEFKNKLFK